MIKNYTHYNIWMNIVLNGQAKTLSGPISVSVLIDELGYTGKRIAVERNGEIVPKSTYASVQIEAGDRLEIVVAVGGG
jgi:sulfur carrier protein